MAQLAHRRGRGAALADHDRGCGIRGTHGVLEVRAERQHHASTATTVSPGPDTSRTFTGWAATCTGVRRP